MASCLISAGRWLLGLDAANEPQWRYEAAIRVDQGMVAQIGTFEAVAYGNDQLARFGSQHTIALPIFAPASERSLTGRLGGAGGRLTPGSAAHIALFPTAGPKLTRRALRAAAFGEDAGSGIVQVFLDGELVIDEGEIVDPAALERLRAALDQPETPAEAALWAALSREL